MVDGACQSKAIHSFDGSGYTVSEHGEGVSQEAPDAFFMGTPAEAWDGADIVHFLPPGKCIQL